MFALRSTKRCSVFQKCVRAKNSGGVSLRSFRVFNQLLLSDQNEPKTHQNEYTKTFNLVSHIVEPWARKQPDHSALILADEHKKEVLSYSELLRQVDSLASSLCQKGNPPKCAIVILPKVAPWWIVNVAGSLSGTIISPGSLMLTEKEILYRLEKCGADALICDFTTMEKVHRSTKQIQWKVLVEQNLEEANNIREGWLLYSDVLAEGEHLQPIRKEFDGDSIAQLFFTSGTTGHPKMVPHTQAGYGIGHQAAAKEWLRLTPEDTYWNISDLGWAKSAYTNLYIPLIAGSTIFVHKMPRFDCKTVLRTLEAESISVLCMPPTAYRAIIQEDLQSFKPKNLKKCVSAGEPLNPEVSEVWYKYTGIQIREAYGQTEATITCAMPFDEKVKPGFVGKPNYGYDLKILNEDHKELGPGEVGQIAYPLKNGWPIGLFKGYLNDEALTEKVFSKGYFLTGDNAYIDEEGYVCYVGRNDDIIKASGYRIGPFEVESALIEHPAVIESAVVGSPSEDRGGLVVKAFIVLTDEYKPNVLQEESRLDLTQEIQDFVKRIIAPYKCPKKVEFVDSLPKTNSGKIRRIELREKESQK